MQKIIYPNLGAKRAQVLVGPAAGLDTCVIEIDREKVLVASTDPLSLIPELGVEESAWMSINLLVNDLATSGFSPQFLIVDLNLPPKLSNAILSSYWRAASGECARLGISIVGGNTGKFEGCDLTIVGSGTIFAIGERHRCIVSSGAKREDKVLLTKGAAISTTGLLARMFPNKVRREYGEMLQRKAAAYFENISALNDAMAASSLGGVTAMHDVAEGGVIASVEELSSASSLGVRIEKSAIAVSTETQKICELFQIDPYSTLGEGAMLITCSSECAEKLQNRMRAEGVQSSIIGEMVDKSEGLKIVDESGNESNLDHRGSDPYWNAYYSAVAKNWD